MDWKTVWRAVTFTASICGVVKTMSAPMGYEFLFFMITTAIFIVTYVSLTDE